MLDIKHIRDNVDAVKAALEKRGSGSAAVLEELVNLDAQRRDKQGQADGLKNKKKTLSQQVGELKKKGEDAAALMDEVNGIKTDIQKLDDDVKQLEQTLRNKLLEIPNLPSDGTPAGTDESQNELVREWGAKPEFGFKIKNHLELGEALGMLDLERAAKISGARFAVFRNRGAALLRALINFMLDVQTRENGYEELYPPVLVNEDSLTGTGQLPKFGEDLFRLRDDDLFLIPTAEVPVTNYHRDEILNAADLPVKYAAYTLCFRREAGSYGKDTQGIIRQHQFDKVELVQFVNPETSYNDLEELVKDAESVLQKLGLHYRVVNLCTGDLGFSAAKTYDLEVWIPSQNTYREISSCSNFTDYQARRAKIRFKGKSGNQLVHTLNGSGVAAGRLFVAVLENFQQEDGSLQIPEALQPYMGDQTVISLSS